MCIPAFLPLLQLKSLSLSLSLSSSMDPHTPSWAALRSDLLLNIANRLDSRVDRLCFRAVSYSWRSVLPPPYRRSASPSPHLKLPFPMSPSFFLNPRRRGYFNLVQSTVYCLQPLKIISDTWKTPKCWFIKIQGTKDTGKVCLTDPLSRFDSKNLSPPLPKTLNLLDYRVSEITRVYDLQFVDNSEIPELFFLENFSLHPKKVAVFSEGAAFAVMALHTDSRLSIWREGGKKWTCINDGQDSACYSDVVCHSGKFYAVDHTGMTISVDLSLKISLVSQAVPPNIDGGQIKRLLSSLGDLFLIVRDLDPDQRGSVAGANSDSDEDDVLSAYIHVYKLNEDKRKWVPVKSLGNRAMFVGDDCSFCVSAQEFRGCKKNCIYYKERCLLCDDLVEDHPGRDAGLFDMDDCSAKMLSRVFSYSGLFWPPPSWVLTADAMR